ncbi:MAG TPA: ribonuclease J [Acidobacteriota bacterium]|nr:ribonuclease J [Acidobacteriota bacterium]
MTDDRMEVIPLGGLGEFGMNMMAIRYREDIVVVDAGLMFPRDDLLGVDLVIPEFTYLLDNKDLVRAVIVTHGHEDHIGALAYLLRELPIPVYGTRLTLGFAKGRLEENGVLEQAQLHYVEARQTLDFGEIHVEILGMTHSIADSIGIAITTPVGTIIHTGDFKFDSSPLNRNVTDYARISALGEQGVLALFSDSTNSERPGFTPSETYVRRHIEQIFYSCRNKIIVACFASSIHRIQIILDLAKDFGRRVLPVGRSMKENIAIASDLGYLNIPPGVMADISDAKTLPEEAQVILSTGSQGEPLAALTRLAFGKHKDVAVQEGDAVILSARVIPGNEGSVSRLVNHFCRRGARIYDESQWTTHVSGHASQEELKLMLNLTRPRYFIPVHGEYRQLYAHTLLAREVGIPPERIILAETGDVLVLRPDSACIDGKAPVGRRFIDVGGVAELDELVVKDRRHLSEEGVVLAVVAVNKATGTVEGVPELVSRGHVQEEDSAAFLAEAREIIIAALEECTREEREDSLVLTEVVRTELKRYFRKRTGTRPMIVPVIYEI